MFFPRIRLQSFGNIIILPLVYSKRCRLQPENGFETIITVILFYRSESNNSFETIVAVSLLQFILAYFDTSHDVRIDRNTHTKLSNVLLHNFNNYFRPTDCTSPCFSMLLYYNTYVYENKYNTIIIFIIITSK